MKSKSEQTKKSENARLACEKGQARMEAYLKATADSFEAAVLRSCKLGTAANGVLVGPVVSTDSSSNPSVGNAT